MINLKNMGISDKNIKSGKVCKNGSCELIHKKHIKEMLNGARCPDCNQKLEEALRDSEARFDLLSGAAFEGILIHDKGTILEVNKRFVSMFGYDKPEELIGKSGLALLDKESQKKGREHIASGSEEPYEVTGIKKDGGRVDFAVHSINARYHSRPVRITALYDITAQKKVDGVLKDKINELQRINQAMVGRELKMVEMKKEIADLKNDIKKFKAKK